MSLLHAHMLATVLALSAGAALAGAPNAPDPRAAALAAFQTVDDAALADLAGGAETVAITEQTLKAVNAGNSVNADTVNNGPVSLSANAFSGFSGIGNFVINTGNNNNLQGSLSVNIVMAPGS